MKSVCIVLLLMYFKRSLGHVQPGLPNKNDLTTPEIKLDQQAVRLVGDCMHPSAGSYVGCFKDNPNSKLLIYFCLFDEKLTPEYCINQCKIRGYTYAGMEFSTECHCGDASTNLESPLDEKFCHMPCTGDLDQMCGGKDIISVYRIISGPVPLPPVCPNIPPTGSYIGCFRDSKTSRLLPYFFINIDLLTPDYCIYACHVLKYSYAGVEFGHECYCGCKNTILKNPLFENSCNMPCAGDENKICGGDGAIRVFKIIDQPGRPLEPDFMAPTRGLVYPPTPRDGMVPGFMKGLPQCQCVPPINSDVGCYIGCYEDGVKRILKFFLGDFHLQTVEHCVEGCKKKGYAFAGVEFRTQCWCGSENTTFFQPEHEKSCGLPCPGDKTQICGGEWRISVYSVNECPLQKPLPPKCRSLPSINSYVGCYDDSATSRLLPYFHETSIWQTPALCCYACKQKGYSFAGMESGKSCYCGDASTILKNPADEKSCKKPCAGDLLRFCGGDLKISVYSLGDRPANIPSLPPCESFPFIHSYIGCYKDSKSNRLLAAHFETHPSLTPRYCIDVCKFLGFSFAGMELGNECYCGISSTIFVNPSHEKACGMPCSGDRNQICGGDQRISVYAVHDGPGGMPMQPKCQCVPFVSSYIGCFLKREGFIKEQSETVSSLTPEYCVSKCKQYGYSYAGVESGDRCHCGSASTTTILLPFDSKLFCQKPCAGDNTKFCGGVLKISVYSVNDFPWFIKNEIN